MFACLNSMPGRIRRLQPGHALVTVRYRLLASAAVIPRPSQMMELREPVLARLGRMPRRAAAVLPGRWRCVDPRSAAQGGEQQSSDATHECETVNEIHR